MNLLKSISRFFTWRRILLSGGLCLIAFSLVVLSRFYISDDIPILGSAQRALGFNRVEYGGENAQMVASHRGYGATDNTIRSISNAINAGATMIEVDVRWCKDGWILFHDKSIVSLADSSGEHLIANLTLEEIQNLLKADKSEDENVITLETMLDRFQSENLTWLIDIKDTGSTEDLENILRKHSANLNGPNFILMGLFEILEQYKSSEFPLGYCAGFSKEWNAVRFLLGQSFVLERCKELGPNLEYLVLPSPFLREDLIADAQAAGLRVWAYSVRKEWDKSSEHKTWLAKGIDGLIVDDLPSGLELLENQ